MVNRIEQKKHVEDEQNDKCVVLSTFPVHSDWFLVSISCGHQREPGDLNVEKAWMERIIFWQNVQFETGVTLLKAIIHSGFAVDIHDDLYESEGSFVSGDDRAPNGQLWRDIYASGSSWTPGFYEICDLSVFERPAK